MKLSIIILTWNSLSLLKRCLSSIEEETTLRDYEIIIIDNNSQDDTVKFLKSIKDKKFKFIFNSKNKGVASARNQGIYIAHGEYILILDVDTIIKPGAIDQMVDYLDKDKNCGLVAPKLTDKEGNLQFTCRVFPTVFSKFLRRFPFEWSKRVLNNEEMRNWDHNSIRVVDYAIGACQMIRKEVIQDIGLLDSKIFYGPEDVDYCIRIWQTGYKVVYNPNAVIIHDEQRITKKMFSKITLKHIIGLIYYFLKHEYMFSRKKIYQTFPVSNRYS